MMEIDWPNTTLYAIYGSPLMDPYMVVFWILFIGSVIGAEIWIIRKLNEWIHR